MSGKRCRHLPQDKTKRRNRPCSDRQLTSEPENSNTEAMFCCFVFCLPKMALETYFFFFFSFSLNSSWFTHSVIISFRCTIRWLSASVRPPVLIVTSASWIPIACCPHPDHTTHLPSGHHHCVLFFLPSWRRASETLRMIFKWLIFSAGSLKIMGKSYGWFPLLRFCLTVQWFCFRFLSRMRIPRDISENKRKPKGVDGWIKWPLYISDINLTDSTKILLLFLLDLIQFSSTV